jgi:hypothetical protein
MDEVIAATAYLDLFLRTIYEPSLLKVFLKFILCAKIDEMSLLDTLIQRINVTTKVKKSKFINTKFQFSFFLSLD